MGLPYDPNCERYALSIAKETKRKCPAGLIDPLSLSTFVLKEFQRRDVFAMTSKIANAYAREQEAKDKKELIENALKEEEDRLKELQKQGKNEENALLGAKMFYLCSEHGDCAQDHEDWQGTLYYDRYWRKYLKSKTKEESDKVTQIVFDLIRKYQMRSLQWVVNRPVWLTTRPNCRHYFLQVTIKEAMSNSVSELIDNKGMYHQVGLRDDGQTIRHSTKGEWYTSSNVEAIIKKYKDRLAYHEKLLKAQPNDLLKGYIDKDKRLIKKWRYLLSKQ